jgi:hypothetical protein
VFKPCCDALQKLVGEAGLALKHLNCCPSDVAVFVFQPCCDALFSPAQHP